MPFKEWCGKPCADCSTSCELDSSMHCNPDCENIDPLTDKPIALSACKACDLYEEEDQVTTVTKTFLYDMARCLGADPDKVSTDQSVEVVLDFVIPYLEDVKVNG